MIKAKINNLHKKLFEVQKNPNSQTIKYKNAMLTYEYFIILPKNKSHYFDYFGADADVSTVIFITAGLMMINAGMKDDYDFLKNKSSDAAKSQPEKTINYISQHQKEIYTYYLNILGAYRYKGNPIEKDIFSDVVKHIADYSRFIIRM